MKHQLDQMAVRCFAENKEKGFWEVPTWAKVTGPAMDVQILPEYTNLKKMEKVMLVVTELAEGVEGIRKHLQSDKIEGFTSEEEEIADALIRLLDYAGGFNLRLGEAFEAKLAFNRSRPHKHGKNF